MIKAITKREDDYSQWYLDVVEAADLAEHSIVKGCMIIKPHGYALWESIQAELDKMIKETGHVNAYFPLFIPKSLFVKEAEHVKGFAKEMAVVTHHRLVDKDGEGVVIDEDSKLEDELIVRPTSETIIMTAYKNWLHSWRDLPIKINQWANVVRWEMRTRFFLRTTEFLWQEGHTVHATEEEAMEETYQMLEVYRRLAEDFLAIPVIKGYKSEQEKFAGAVKTTTIEAMMQDGKALQSGTSHFLGKNFSKAFGLEYVDQNGEMQSPFTTSWGLSTRIIGALIMTHSDDKGLVIPPKVAQTKCVVIPIWRDDNREPIKKYCNEILNQLKQAEIKYNFDDRDNLSPGAKFNEWEKKGIPVRIEVGPKDMESKSVVVVRRDTSEKKSVAVAELHNYITELLENIQKNMFEKALNMQKERSYHVTEYDELKKIIKEKGGFVYAPWCGCKECEDNIKYETKASSRCRPLDGKKIDGKCVYCGKHAEYEWIFSLDY